MNLRSWVGAAAAVALAACEPMGPGSGFVATTGDSGSTDDSSATSTVQSTQVGSEGLWGCPIDAIDPLDPREDVAGFGVAEDVLAGLVRPFELAFPTDPAVGALTLQATAYSLQHSSTCGDAIVASATGTADRGSAPLGLLAQVGTDGSRSVIAASFSDEPAAVAAAWLLPEAPVDTVGVRLVLAPDPNGLFAGEVSFAACGPDDFDCAARTTAVDLTAL